MSQDLVRAYPSSELGERGLVSCMLQNPAHVVPWVLGKVEVTDFHQPAAALVFSAVVKCYDKGIPIELDSLMMRLIDEGTIAQAGGPGGVAEIYSAAPTPAHYEFYAEDVLDKSRRRQGIELAEKLKDAFYAADEPWLPGVEDVEATLMAMRRTNSRKGLRTGREVIIDLARQNDMAFRHRGNPMGLCLGFPDIDRVINGLQPADFVVIAARPAMGKTSLGTAFAEAVAVDAANKQNRPVFLITLEMSDVQIMQRSVLGRARVALSKGRTGMFSAAEGMVWRITEKVIHEHRQADTEELTKQLIFAAVDELEARWERKTLAKPDFTITSAKVEDSKREIMDLSASIASISCGLLSFYDGYAVTTQEIRAQIREWVRRNGWVWDPSKSNQQPPLVVIDYIQLVKASEKKSKGDPRLTLMETCEMLKGIAKELGVVVMPLAQVGRGAEENPGKIPQLKDLKESGAIEEYADIVGFLHRPSYYKKWEDLKEESQEKFDSMAQSRNASGDARTLREPSWSGETFYNALATFALRKARGCGLADIDILFRAELSRFSPKTAHLYSNDSEKRQQPTVNEDLF